MRFKCAWRRVDSKGKGNTGCRHAAPAPALTLMSSYAALSDLQAP